MPVEYLAYLNLILLTRLIYLVRDQALAGRASAILTVIQCVLCAAAFQWNTTLWVMLACVIVFTGAGWLVERKIKSIAIWRLISLAGLVLIPGVFFSGNASYAFSSLYTGLGEAVSAHVPLLDAEVLDGSVSLLLFACLIVANEANIAMRVILHYCNLEPRKKDPAGEVDEEEFQAGRIIGVLERWLMLLIVLYSDDLSALGFIIAAKGLVRFNKFGDERFAEYVLVGTLLSVLAAVVVAKWVSVLKVI